MEEGYPQNSSLWTKREGGEGVVARKEHPLEGERRSFVHDGESHRL